MFSILFIFFALRGDFWVLLFFCYLLRFVLLDLSYWFWGCLVPLIFLGLIFWVLLFLLAFAGFLWRNWTGGWRDDGWVLVFVLLFRLFVFLFLFLFAELILVGCFIGSLITRFLVLIFCFRLLVQQFYSYLINKFKNLMNFWLFFFKFTFSVTFISHVE